MNSLDIQAQTITGPDISMDFSYNALVKYIVVFVSGTLASAVGVGGGAVYTVLYIILFGLVYEAVPLSKVAVLASAISYFFQNVLEPVPKETKHINRFAYDVVMIMEPATLLGTVYGVLASRILPFWFITVLMTILLSYSAEKTFKKAHSIHRKEVAEGIGASHEPLVASIEHGNAKEYGTITKLPENVSLQSHIEIIDMEKQVGSRENWLWWRSNLTIIVCFVLVSFDSVIASHHSLDIMPLDINCGGFIFYMTILLISLMFLIITIGNVRYLQTEHIEHNNALTMNWNYSTSNRVVLLCFLAGFFSSLCGIGGSTIKNPLMLYLEINPTLAKATAQFMLLTTVSSSVIQFSLYGSVPLDYAVVFFVLAGISTIIGKTVIDEIIRRSGRESTIVFLLAWYIVFALVTMSGIGIIIIAGQVASYPNVDWAQLGLRSPCDVSPPDFGALKLITGG